MVSKRSFTATHEAFSQTEQAASPSSVLEQTGELPAKRRAMPSAEATADLCKRKSQLEAECSQASAPPVLRPGGLPVPKLAEVGCGQQVAALPGPSMLLHVAECGDPAASLLVHVCPSHLRPHASAGPLPDQWKIMTLKVPPDYPSTAPVVLLHCGSTVEQASRHKVAPVAVP